jgi:membrane-bound lytic murein transglycosylase D
MDKETFGRYNPGFDKTIASQGKYELRLPTNKMEIFLQKKFDILAESMQILLTSSPTN